MKRMKKVWGIFLATVLLVTMFSNTAFAAISVPKSQTVYLTSKNGTSSVSIPVNGLTKKQKITKSSVKSSNTSVMAPSSLDRNTNEYTTQYINNKSKDYSSSYVSSSIYFDAKKAGTSTITFKVGSKSYKSKVTVKKYVNPATTIIIPGVNSGKNIASRYRHDRAAVRKYFAEICRLCFQMYRKRDLYTLKRFCLFELVLKASEERHVVSHPLYFLMP